MTPMNRSLFSVLLALSCFSFQASAQELFRRGDPAADGKQNVTDAVVVLSFLFTGGVEPPCRKSADADDNGALQITDAVFLLNYLFLGGPAAPEPFSQCGADPTADSLSCESYPLCEFESLVASYNLLSTFAGKGEFRDSGRNAWEPRFEGGPAVAAELSRPHFAMADDAGMIYIADKEAHAIRKITLDGKIFTVAGTNVAGDDGDEPGKGTERRLSSPNGLWVRGDGTLYILDLDNGKVRRLDASGVMTTLITVEGGIPIGRGLWVSADETLVYFSSGTEVKKWTPSSGVNPYAVDFVELGNLVVDSGGALVVTDRGAHRVYRIQSDGQAVPIAGNGQAGGGGDGALALETGLQGVRGVWFVPDGRGYFLATHEGNQVWYVDSLGIIHLFLDGGDGHTHSGDGEFFHSPGYKVSEVRAVTLDRAGNLIVTENDYGFVRRVERR